MHGSSVAVLNLPGPRLRLPQQPCGEVLGARLQHVLPLRQLLESIVAQPLGGNVRDRAGQEGGGLQVAMGPGSVEK